MRVLQILDQHHLSWFVDTDQFVQNYERLMSSTMLIWTNRGEGFWLISLCCSGDVERHSMCDMDLKREEKLSLKEAQKPNILTSA